MYGLFHKYFVFLTFAVKKFDIIFIPYFHPD